MRNVRDLVTTAASADDFRVCGAFSVSGGLPFLEALGSVSSLLCGAADVVHGEASDAKTAQLHCALASIRMAKALVDSTLATLEQSEYGVTAG